jgi:hypothetical protein
VQDGKEEHVKAEDKRQKDAVARKACEKEKPAGDL